MKVNLDIDAVQKGDIFTSQMVGGDLPTGLSEREWYHQLHIWAQTLQGMLLKAGLDFTIKIRGDQVYVLNDLEAEKVNQARFKQDERNLGLRRRLMCAVDTSTFTEQQKRTHENHLMYQAAVINGISHRKADLCYRH